MYCKTIYEVYLQIGVSLIVIFHNKQVVDQDLVYNELKYEDVKHNNTCILRNLFNTISQECIWAFRKKNKRIRLKLII